MRSFSILLFITFIVVTSRAQHVQKFTDSSVSNISYSKSKNNTVQISFNLSDIAIANSSEEYFSIESKGFAKSLKKGEPNLPVLSKLIVFPLNVDPLNEIISFDSEKIDLKKKGFTNYMEPSLGSFSKSIEKISVNEIEKSVSYSKNEYVNEQIVSFKRIGILRNVQVFELIYQPIAYNPVKNKIEIRTNVEFSVSWDNNIDISDEWKFGFEEDASLGQIISLENGSAKNFSKPTLLIVSPTKYKETLQQYILWKRKLGYYVSEAYIDEDIADNSKETIKSYIKNYYENPDQGTMPVSYLALIGDVIDIPAWSSTIGANGTIDSHVTDLYYAEFTDDFLPELYYGRISVTDESQLQNIIDKTLFTEQANNLPDAYQNNHLLVSGVDANFAPDYGNGAVNYFTNYYSNSNQGINAKYYLYGSGSPILSNSSEAKQSIIDDFSNGVGVAYYTAHCSYQGWSGPVFETADISSLNNKNMYPLMIGNCCYSAKFNVNSFGEDIVRAKDKGAAVYIGASDESLWDEDYYWGVGVTNNINDNPTYEETGIGNWDAWFHLNGESIENHVVTVGQMLMVGNLAVQESNSTSKKYYWEIYHIIGDPTFVPAKNNMSKITAELPQTFVAGQTQLNVNTTAGAYVSLAENGDIIGGTFADETGLASIDFVQLENIGEKLVEIVVSHKDFAPLFDSIDVIAPDGPYLVLLNTEIDDSMGNENSELEHDEIVYLNVGFQNYGNDNAEQVKVSITSESEWVKSFTLNSNVDYSVILNNQRKFSDLQFLLELVSGIPNNTEILFEGIATCNDTVSFEFEFVVTANSPDLVFEKNVADVDGSGNYNGVLEPNEQATIQVYFINEGFAQVSNTVIEFTSRNPELLLPSTDVLAFGGFEIDESKAIPMEVLTGNDIFNGAQAIIDFEIRAGDNQQFISQGMFKVTVGEQPEIIMDEDAVIDIVTGIFYDSGGPESNYTDNENYTVTFKPYYTSQGVSIDFEEFDIESKTNGDCYDYLEIYDGLTINSPMIGAFCSSNYIKEIQSQNQDGALTFRFKSDVAKTLSGWKGIISSSERRTVKFVVSNGVDKIEDVLITLLNDSLRSDTEGNAEFANILEDGIKGYVIEKEGYYTINNELGYIEGDTTINILLEKLPEVCITVQAGTTAIENARVQFNNITQYTDSQGQVFYPNQQEGSYFFSVSIEGYNDTTGYITVPRNDMCYFMSISKKKFYSLDLLVQEEEGVVDSAKVTINGDTLYTNKEGMVVIDSLYSESYLLSIEKEKYKTYTSNISIPDSNSVKEIEIDPYTYSVIFNVFHGEDRVSGAKILLKDMELITSEGGQAAANDLRIENNIEFVIEHDGYNKYTGHFDIVDKSLDLDIQIYGVGVSDAVDMGVIVFPNPLGSNKILHIQSDENIRSVEVFNADGKKVMYIDKKDKNLKIDMSDLSKGIYIISVDKKSGKYYEKVVLP